MLQLQNHIYLLSVSVAVSFLQCVAVIKRDPHIVVAVAVYLNFPLVAVPQCFSGLNISVLQLQSHVNLLSVAVAVSFLQCVAVIKRDLHIVVAVAVYLNFPLFCHSCSLFEFPAFPYF